MLAFRAVLRLLPPRSLWPTLGERSLCTARGSTSAGTVRPRRRGAAAHRRASAAGSAARMAQGDGGDDDDDGNGNEHFNRPPPPKAGHDPGVVREEIDAMDELFRRYGPQLQFENDLGAVDTDDEARDDDGSAREGAEEAATSRDADRKKDGDDADLFDSILDLPRDAVESADLDLLRPPSPPTSARTLDDVAPMPPAAEHMAARPPPHNESYIPTRDTPEVDWRYWKFAGVRLDRVHCPGCGVEFQSLRRDRPGFVHEFMLRDIGSVKQQEMKPTICYRCHKLTHDKQEEDNVMVHQVAPFAPMPPELLEPSGVEDAAAAIEAGAASEQRAVEASPPAPPPAALPDLSAKMYRQVVSGITKRRCVVLYLVDVTDFHGTAIRSLPSVIGGQNPIVVAANKCDLLPKGFSTTRVNAWLREELRHSGLASPYDVHLISASHMHNVKVMINQVYGLAKYGKCDIVVLGSTNVGKSMLINHIVQFGWHKGRKEAGRWRLRLTTSVMPATTLNAVPVATGDGKTLYDTPGLLNPGSMTSRLLARELRHVVAEKALDCFTVRFSVGNSLLFGGLARVDHLKGDSLLVSWFCSPGVKVHQRRTDGVDEWVKENAGTASLYPPMHFDEFFPHNRWSWEDQRIELTCDSHRAASHDVAVAGLGWISVTGVGSLVVNVRVPAGVKVFVRPPLLPYEAMFGAATFTGSKWVNRNKERLAATLRRRLAQMRKQQPHVPYPDLEGKDGFFGAGGAARRGSRRIRP